jgi:hypothetical protein
MTRTRIFTDIDYDKDGKQIGWLYLPHSVNRSAYGNIAAPIAVIRNGAGPTVFFMAGNHGDEYEGQIALGNLIRALEPGQIRGRVIVMPAANLPAVLNGTRISPVDDGNFNRAFPGDPDASPTFAIAHYVDSVLFPMCDLFHDIHSGGSSLAYLPFVSVRRTDDEAFNARSRAALMAHGAPNALIWAYSHDNRWAAAAAQKRGVVALGGEFGGMGSVSIDGVRIVERGVRNLLVHQGVLPQDARQAGDATRLLEVRGRDYYVLAPCAGLFEPMTELGQTVAAGQPCGRVHFVDDPAREPVVVHYKAAGMVMCKRHPGRVERGDCVAHLATDVQG